MATTRRPPREPVFAIYLRVSTDMQVQEGYSLGTQERLCREYIERKLGHPAAQIKAYREEGRSGAYTVRQLRKGNEPIRQVLSDLIDDADDGKITHIVTYEMSRMSREFDDWIMIHRLLLQPAGIKVWVAQNDLDLDDEDDEFVGNLLALVSDRERKLIRRRIIDARESRRKDGYLPGGHPTYGWRWEPLDQVPPGGRRNIEPDPEEAKWVRWMADRILNDGWGVVRLGKELYKMGVESSPGSCRWTGPEVWARIRHEMHAGLIKDADGSLIKGAHYDKRLWDPDFRLGLIETLSSRRVIKGRTATTAEFPLLGIITCGRCGRPLRPTHSRNGQAFYRCDEPELGSPHDCPGVMRRADHVEAQVVKMISDLVNSPTLSTLIGEEAVALIEARRGDHQAALSKLNADIRAMDTRLEKLALAFTDGQMNPEQFQKLNAKWQADYDELCQQRERLQGRAESDSADRLVLKSVEAGLRNFAQTWEQAGAQRTRELLSSIVEWLRLTPDGDNARLSLKLHLLPEMEASVPRSQAKDREATGVDGLSLRELAMLAHLADGRSQEETARLMAVKSIRTRLQIARKTAGISDLNELIEAAKPRIEELRPILPLGEASVAAKNLARPPVSPRQQQVCELYAENLPIPRICQEMGVSRAAVNGLILQARRSIEHWLETHPDEADQLAPELRYTLEVRRREDLDKPLVMPPRLQEVLELHRQGLSDEQIAQRLGLKVTSARSCRHQARKKARELEEGRRAIESGQRPKRPKPKGMTRRLRQVVDYDREGLSDEQIAQRMGVKVETVRVYRSQAKRRVEQMEGAAACRR